MHFTVCIVAINNRRKKHPDDKQRNVQKWLYVNHGMFFETFEMMYVSRVRTKHCDWATENRRQPDPLRFHVCLRQKYCLSQTAKNSKTNVITNTEAPEVNVQSRESSGFFKNVFQPNEVMNILTAVDFADECC